MNQRMLRNLRERTKAWQQSAAILGQGASALAEWYEVLANLVSTDPLVPVDFSRVVKKTNDLPKGLQQLVKSAANALGQQHVGGQLSIPEDPLQRWRKSLEELTDLTNPEGEHGLHPDFARVNEIAHNWLDLIKALKNGAEGLAKITIEVTPSLLLNEKEERRQGFIGYNITLPVVLSNQGDLPALDVSISCSCGDNSTPSRSEEFLGIPSGQALVYLVPDFPFTETSTVRLTATYTDVTTRTNSRHVDHFHDLIPPQQSCQLLQNPYVPGSPMPHEWFENQRVFGNHEGIVKEIMSLSDGLKKGRVFSIAGFKRSGKTSLMREVQYRLEHDQENLLPVYVDLDDWYHAFLGSSDEIDTESLLYELSYAILEPLQDANETTPDLQEIIQQLEDLIKKESNQTERLKAPHFKELLKKLRTLTGRFVVFLLDEFDVLLREKKFSEDARHVLVTYLRNLADEGLVSLILAYDFASDHLRQKYLRNWLFHQFDIRHLDESETIKLAKIVVSDGSINPYDPYRNPQPYSALALAYIWRVTGGWPGLAQVLLYQIFSSPGRDRSRIIDVVDVKTIVREQLLSSNNPALKDLRSALSGQELSALRCLQRAEAIDPATSYIKGVRFQGDGDHNVLLESEVLQSENLSLTDFKQAIYSLKSNQVIDLVNESAGTYRLRVGLFYYDQAIQAIKQGGEA